MTTEATPELEGIAIVGLAAHLPGSRTIAGFWRNLREGVESIRFFTDEELLESGIDPALVRAPNYIKACGILGDTDQFDAAFFGLNPREAALMDPQHRVFLQCAWEAMETAGYSPERQPGRTGVFGGMSMNTYLLTNVYPHLSHVASVESLQASIGNDKDALTTEVAYRLNLKGPAVTIQSSSSTSLTAIHYACQSLLSYECDMALAGGVSIHFPEKQGYLFYEGGTTSPDGHCRPFDAKAQGFVSGHGAGVVALRRLADAIAAGDTIYAVVKATAVNNDGSQKVSYMAPSVEGQAEVVSLAQALAGVEPDTIGYVECHGTATLMGDPIEVAALTQAFRAGTDKKGFCALGSVKSNIGHLDSAAGAVGLIKAALVLHHKQIPPTLHFESPNPAIDFANSPFYVNTRLSEWPEGETPRRAGVTSLGMGGTNAHAILEEAPTLPAIDKPRRPAHVLMISARSDASLEAATDRLASHLRENPDLSLADVAYTLQVGRKRFARRRTVVCHTLADALEALSSRDPARVFSGGQETGGRPVMFMFSGQGTQYVDMGRHLHDTEPVFRDEVDACAKKLEKHLGFDLRTVLYPPEAQREAATERLTQTSLAQPALFVIEYALAKLWMSWGLKPQAMIGHSIGEYVAACLAGVFTLEDALALVAARGRLMQQMPAGAMLAVPMTEAQVLPLLGAGLSLAAVNSPETCVVAGPIPAIDALAEKLTAQGVTTTRLHTSHAFHSSMMDPILEAFRDQVRRVSRQVPQLPYLSNVTGRWITTEEATSPDYWAKHLRQAVRFADGLGELLKEADAILLEVGPGQTLATLARQHPAKAAQHVVINSLRHPREQKNDLDFLLGTLGRLWLAGVEPDWDAFYGDEKRRRIALPTAPFERQRHWVDPPENPGQGKPQGASADKKQDVSRWFYLPSWQRALPPSSAWSEQKACWWLLVPESHAQGGLGASLARRLAEAGQQVITVTPGTHLAQLGERHWSINPRGAADFASLLQQLTAQGLGPDRILHLWSAVPESTFGASTAAFDPAQELGFHSLLFLAQALGRQETKPVSLTVVTHRMQALGDELPSPEKATVLGPVRVIPQEYPHLSCKSVDVSLPAPGGWQEPLLAEQLLAECAEASRSQNVIAYRGQQRQVQVFEPVPAREPGYVPLRDQGVYLLLGGFGTIGYSHAEVLAKRARARLVLVGRSALPERSTWDSWLAAHDEKDPIARRIRKVQALEALGAEVLVVSADVADRAQLRAAVDQTLSRFGALHGVVFSAGTVDTSLFRTLADATPADARFLFQSRALGLYALEEVLRGQMLDFCMLASSLAAVLGGVGRASYSAAMSFMDAFALRQTQTSPVPWMSVGWDAWASDTGPNPFGSLSITASEGAEAFTYLLSLGAVAQVAVSTSHLPARVERTSQPEPQKATEARAEHVVPDAQSQQAAPRPAMQNAYVAPRDELEESVAKLWESMLGITQVGIHDNFFELGGNSLVGIKLIARVREQFGVQLPAVTLYEGPTVEALAKLLKAASGGSEEEQSDGAESRSRGERRRARRQRRGGDSATDEEN